MRCITSVWVAKYHADDDPEDEDGAEDSKPTGGLRCGGFELVPDRFGGPGCGLEENPLDEEKQSDRDQQHDPGHSALLFLVADGVI